MQPFDPKKYAGCLFDEIIKSANEAVAAGKSSLAEAQGIYKLCIDQKIDRYTRGRIRQQLWAVEKTLGIHPLYYSQAGQDKFVHETFFKGKRGPCGHTNP